MVDEPLFCGVKPLGRNGIALLRVGDRQLCTQCATEEHWQEVDGPNDVVTDQEIERRVCLAFCDQCGAVVNK